MNPQIVGAWDGSHVWLQWDPVLDSKYEVRLRFGALTAGGLQWEEWQPTIKPALAWFVYQVQERKPGTPVGVAVRVVSDDQSPGPEDGWETALEARFVRSVCSFEFSSKVKPLHFLERTNFHCRVDGAVCSYRLTEEIEVAPGEIVTVGMEALASGGFAQLDHPDHFLIRPMLGVTIRNTVPSWNDLELTGRDFTQISVPKRDGPFSMVILPPKDLR